MEPNNQPVAVAKPKQLLGSIELIKRAWVFYKANFRRLWPLYLLGSLGSLGLQFQFSDKTAALFSGHSSVVAVVVALVIIVSILLFLSQIALLKSIVDVRKGQYEGIKSAYKKSSKFFWPYIVILIMLSLAKAGAMVLFIVPGIILAGYLSFTSCEFFDQEKKGFKALLGSWSLVRGYWKSVVWRWIVISILISLTMLIVIIPLAIVGTVLVIVAVAIKSTAMTVISVSVGLIIIAIFCLLLVVPLGIITMFELYYNLKEVRSAEKLADEAVDRRRRFKLIWAMIIGVLAFIVAFMIGIYLVAKLEKTANSGIPASAIIPGNTYFTSEDASDAFTIDYPANWHKEFETTERVNGNYFRTAQFAPNLVKKIPGDVRVASTTISLYINNVEPGIKTVEDFKNYFLERLMGDKTAVISDVKTSTTTIGIFSALELSYTHKISPAGFEPVTFKVTDKIVLLGDYVYILEYRSDPLTYDDNIEVFENMTKSWYLHYFQRKSGSDSLIYDNRDYGISLEYPSAWIQIGATPETGLVAQFIRPDFDNQGLFDPGKSIAVWIEKFSGNLELFKKNTLKSVLVGDNVLKSVSPITIGQQDGYEMTYEWNDGNDLGSSIIYLTIRDGRGYSMVLNGLAPDDPLIAKFRSSFKFLESEPQSRNNDEETYDNRQFGYKLTVPKQWTKLAKTTYEDKIVDSYSFVSGDQDSFMGVLSVSAPDDYYHYNGRYSVERYRDDNLEYLKNGPTTLEGFSLLQTGTTTIGKLPSAYYVGKYQSDTSRIGGIPPILRIKQLFIDNDGTVRWISYIDDEADFEKYLPMINKIMESLRVR
ncbi:MAG: hypothetical protein WCT02_01725 [Candidatus Paceibacterota bacterium]